MKKIIRSSCLSCFLLYIASLRNIGIKQSLLWFTMYSRLLWKWTQGCSTTLPRHIKQKDWSKSTFKNTFKLEIIISVYLIENDKPLIIIRYLCFFRERKRERERDDLWKKLENLSLTNARKEGISLELVNHHHTSEHSSSLNSEWWTIANKAHWTDTFLAFRYNLCYTLV